MVCYNLEKRIVYIHVPKTGGMSIERILIDNFGFKNFTFKNGKYEFLHCEEGKQGFFKYILKYSNESKEYDLNSFRKFTMVRNPYLRAASAIRFLSERYLETDMEFPSNLSDFYNDCLNKPFLFVHFIMSQCLVLKDLNDEINYEFIGKFENYNNDLEHMIFNLMQFPRIDISKYHIHKTDPNMIEFDHEMVDLMVNKLHDDDFDRFDYLKKY